MPDYFHPESDVRMSLNDKTITPAHYHSLSTRADRIDSAGFLIERRLEPALAPLPEISGAEIQKNVPYDSAD